MLVTQWWHALAGDYVFRDCYKALFQAVGVGSTRTSCAWCRIEPLRLMGAFISKKR